MPITTPTRSDMRKEEAGYAARVHPTSLHIPKTRQLLAELAARSSADRVDVWPELETIDPTAWGRQINASNIKAAFRSYMQVLQGGRCCYCRIWLVANAHARPIEHILPRAGFPQHSLCFWNLAMACADCNAIKRDTVWGSIPATRRTYPKPAACHDFFHARFHKYNEHLRYVMVETNTTQLTMYIGLTEQGRHLCGTLLHKVAARRTLYASNPELQKSKQAIEEYKAMMEAQPTPALDAFAAAVDELVTRRIA